MDLCQGRIPGDTPVRITNHHIILFSLNNDWLFQACLKVSTCLPGSDSFLMDCNRGCNPDMLKVERWHQALGKPWEYPPAAVCLKHIPLQVKFCSLSRPHTHYSVVKPAFESERCCWTPTWFLPVFAHSRMSDPVVSLGRMPAGRRLHIFKSCALMKAVPDILNLIG